MEGAPNSEAMQDSVSRGVGYKATGGGTLPGRKSQDEEQKGSIPLPSFCPILDSPMQKVVTSKPWQSVLVAFAPIYILASFILCGCVRSYVDAPRYRELPGVVAK